MTQSIRTSLVLAVLAAVLGLGWALERRSAEASAATSIERAREARAQWRLDTARAHFAAALRHRTDDVALRLEAAETEMRRGAPAELRALLEGVPQEDEGEVVAARVQLLLGAASFFDDAPEAALGRLERAEALASGSSEPSATRREIAAEAALRRANLLFVHLERADDARAALARVLELSGPATSDPRAALALAQDAQLRWWTDPEAADPGPIFEQTLATLRAAEHRAGTAEVLSMQSFLAGLRGDWAEFFRRHQEATETFEQVGDRAGAAGSHMIFGWAYHRLGRGARAASHYQQGLDAAEETGVVFEAERLRWMLARSWLDRARRRGADAPELLDRAQELVQRNALRGKEGWRVRLTTTLAEIELARGLPERALGHLDQLPFGTDTDAAREQGAGDDRLGLVALLVRARAQLVLGESDPARLAEASATLTAARRLVREDEEAGRRAEIASLEARLAQALGQARRATDLRLDAFLLGRLDHGALRTADPDPELLRGLVVEGRFEDLHQVLDSRGYEVVRALAPPSSHGQPSQIRSGESASLDEARAAAFSAADAFLAEGGAPATLAELRTRYADYEARLLARASTTEGAALRSAVPRSLDAVRSGLPATTRLVRPFFVGAGSQADAMVLIVGPETVRVVDLGTTRGALDAKAKLTLRLLGESEAKPAAALDTVAASLGQVLLGPLERSGAFDGVERLAWVPAGPLVDLPLGLLRLGEQRLAERFAIHRLPSLSFVARSAADRAVDAERSLVVGLSRPVDGRLAALPAVGAEARAVARSLGVAGFPEAIVLLDDAATEPAVRGALAGVRWFHFAGHGMPSAEMPLLAHLPLAGGPGDGSRPDDDGRLTVREILSLRLDADLVTLSACGGATRPAAETGDLGLADAFLLAGAGGVVASVAPVTDECAARVMDRFYGELTASPDDPVGAMARTQLSLRAEGLASACWATFVLVGGPV